MRRPDLTRTTHKQILSQFFRIFHVGYAIRLPEVCQWATCILGQSHWKMDRVESLQRLGEFRRRLPALHEGLLTIYRLLSCACHRQSFWRSHYLQSVDETEWSNHDKSSKKKKTMEGPLGCFCTIVRIKLPGYPHSGSAEIRVVFLDTELAKKMITRKDTTTGWYFELEH